MLDGSGSIGSTNFLKIKNFVRAVTSQLNVGPDPVLNSRVSVSLFSSSLYHKFDFDQYTTVSAYQNAINAIPYPRGGRKTIWL